MKTSLPALTARESHSHKPASLEMSSLLRMANMSRLALFPDLFIFPPYYVRFNLKPELRYCRLYNRVIKYYCLRRTGCAVASMKSPLDKATESCPCVKTETDRKILTAGTVCLCTLLFLKVPGQCSE
ncbi:hypothetical protein RRG08_019959 [Elysia crispata]|uniref:Uncharacterized protein n=1 Tax=Elysia crispata TaxID=231223 RepID=A0AAE0YJ77_9GAST|nr:hypothetical protein RRG08_019959 [Elysia crispata]